MEVEKCQDELKGVCLDAEQFREEMPPMGDGEGHQWGECQRCLTKQKTPIYSLRFYSVLRKQSTCHNYLRLSSFKETLGPSRT